jgi:hypothetical protein
MTLRTIESEFAELLLKQTEKETSFDLTIDGPLWNQVHPKVLLAGLKFDNQLPEVLPLPGFHYDCFANFTDAKLAYPDISLEFEGRPWTVKKFIEGAYAEAIIYFKDFGTIVLSKNEMSTLPKPLLYWHTLPLWMNYALSPELWGAQGKWTRFHLRLENLFKEKNLLVSSTTGYYSLKSEASKLRDHGFHGTDVDKTYVLVLPWTFSLSALEKLEEIVRQEF